MDVSLSNIVGGKRTRKATDFWRHPDELSVLVGEKGQDGLSFMQEVDEDDKMVKDGIVFEPLPRDNVVHEGSEVESDDDDEFESRDAIIASDDDMDTDDGSQLYVPLDDDCSSFSSFDSDDSDSDIDIDSDDSDDSDTGA